MKYIVHLNNSNYHKYNYWQNQPKLHRMVLANAHIKKKYCFFFLIFFTCVSFICVVLIRLYLTYSPMFHEIRPAMPLKPLLRGTGLTFRNGNCLISFPFWKGFYTKRNQFAPIGNIFVLFIAWTLVCSKPIRKSQKLSPLSKRFEKYRAIIIKKCSIICKYTMYIF